jgi:hypothetical protein
MSMETSRSVAKELSNSGTTNEPAVVPRPANENVKGTTCVMVVGAWQNATDGNARRLASKTTAECGRIDVSLLAFEATVWAERCYGT